MHTSTEETKEKHKVESPRQILTQLWIKILNLNKKSTSCISTDTPKTKVIKYSPPRHKCQRYRKIFEGSQSRIKAVIVDGYPISNNSLSHDRYVSAVLLYKNDILFGICCVKTLQATKYINLN
jgi:hypothetical protein